MAKYVLLMRSFETGATKMLLGGPGGVQEQVRAIEELGATVVSQHVVLGDQDLVLVVDFPDEATVLATQMAAEAGGMYVNPLRVCEPDEVSAAYDKFPGLAEFTERLAGPGS